MPSPQAQTQQMQRTIAGATACAGVGLHSGDPVALRLAPAGAGAGIVFVARARDGACVELPAREAFVSATANAVTLTKDGASVTMVEHLLAAARGCGVDNLRVEVEGMDLPALDGSAAPFSELMRGAGIVAQRRPRSVLSVRRPVSRSDGDRSIRVDPAPCLRISYAIDFPHPAIGRQELEIDELTPEVFERELAPARTFGFLADEESLRRAGLARGVSFENTLVLDESRVLNDSGLRWADEFVRHKVVDLLGDLALLGHALVGHVRVERGGHALHRALVRELLARPDACTLSSGKAPRPVSRARSAPAPGFPSPTDP